MNHIYRVPIIPQNLNKQETIIQVAEVLEHISNITEDLFKHMNNRIETNNHKLNDITERITKVNLKISKLKGAKKATQVFSSCKYPGAELNRQYVSVFNNVTPCEITRHAVTKNKKAAPCDETFDNSNIYHVKVRSTSREKVGAVSGLGGIPNDLYCVNDLLLYNSGKNLYTNFVMSDALEGSEVVNEEVLDDSSHMGAAPHSISERSNLTRSSTQNYFYTPNLGEVPSLDVPLDLPDLPGIADDLRYERELGPGIAPSVTTTPNIPDLPIIDPIYVKEEEILPEIALPPPPPPPVEEIKLPEPPPPIEIINKITENNNIESVPVKSTRVQEVSQIDGRASLMDAIRKAGGSKNAKLKSTSQSEQPEDSSKAKVTAGNDLMADLHAKLSMRRKGISGAKRQEGLDAGSTLGKISAMIPPPSASSELNNDTTEDEDWDD